MNTNSVKIDCSNERYYIFINPKILSLYKGTLAKEKKKRKENHDFALADKLYKTMSKAILPGGRSCPENKSLPVFCCDTGKTKPGKDGELLLFQRGKEHLNFVLPKLLPMPLQLTASEGASTTILSLLMPHSSSYHRSLIRKKQIFL